ncbi:hypothetical protein ACF9IK_05185 [Kitasatospora hibisci]|uniref:hypothetical protein n=1 Tax=Kitasatospora hibisci TaxID=3369522 RepID=UPI0037547DF9
MRRLVNRAVLGLAGFALTALSASVLLVAAGFRPPGRWLHRVPGGPSEIVVPCLLPVHPLAPRSWDDSFAVAVAATGALCLLLLAAQALPGTPARLDLRGGRLRTRALTDAVRTRAEEVPGVVGARARMGRGRSPVLELTVCLSEQASPADAVDPLLEVLAEASDSTGLSLRPRLRLRPARSVRRRSG